MTTMITENRGLLYLPSGVEVPHMKLSESGCNYIPVTPEILPFIEGVPLSISAQNAVAGLERGLLQLAEWRKSLNERKMVDVFSFQHMPMTHQLDAISRMLLTKRTCLWADCGLGKTYIAIMLANEMKRLGLFKGAVVVCPISLIEAVWAEEIPKFSNMTFCNMRKKKRPKNVDFYIINYEQLSKLKNELKTLGCNVIFFDESTKIKTNTSKMWKAANDIVNVFEYRYLMSGSPMPNGPKDAWAQMFILDRGLSLGRSFSYYLDRTHKEIKIKNTKNVFRVPTASGATWTKRQVEKLSLRYDKRECLDLPGSTDITLRCDMTAQQRKAYDELKSEHCTLIDGEYVVARSALALLPKFQQITGGFAKSVDGGIVAFKDNPKLDLLMDTIASIPEKMIVWVWFRHEIEAIVKRLTDINASFVHVYGQMNDKVVNDNIKMFKGETQILVANQAVLGYGHNLVCANYALTYSNPTDYNLRHQSRERIDRKGQNKHMFFYDFVVKDSVDEKILRGLANHGSMMKYMLKAGV